MFIDYITLMLLNMVAGLVLAAGFITIGLGRENQRPWAAPFFMVALVALITGFMMALTWPVPARAYNVAFGEMTVVFGAVFLGAALATAFRTSLMGVAIYGAIGGAVAVTIGIRILHLLSQGIHMTARPELSAAGFIATGLAAMLIPLALTRKCACGLRILVGILLIAAALLWASVTGMAYWMHLEMWLPKPT